jgi:glycosyltransferase involved in cell wall biosynthesis
MICYQYAPAADGGAERQAQRLAEELSTRGHDVGVVTTRAPGVTRRERLGGVDVNRVWSVWKRGWVSLTFLPSLAFFLLLRGRRYDVWHVHQVFYHYFVAVCVARLVGRQCLVKAAASGPHGDIARLRTSPLGGLVMRALPLADAVVSLNRELSVELERAGVANGRARLIRNGVDLRAFAPPTAAQREAARQALSLESGAVAVVFVGRLSAAKGVHALLDAWRLVESRDEPVRAQLFLAGDGEEAAAVRARLSSEVLRARMLGRLPDVRGLLRAADVLVLPSESEGLSNAVLEAMAMAVPIVATRIGGLDEQVEDGVTGTLVPAGDAESLARALLSLIHDEDRRRALGTRGREVVERRFGFADTVDAYERLYEDVTSSRPGSR